MELRSGARVMVTGAPRGIGDAFARAFSARGCTLGLVARSTDQLERLAAGLPGDGHRALAGDVSDAASIARAVEQFGDVDVLVANAGISHYLPFEAMPLELAEQLTRVNLVVSSGAGLRAFPHVAVYGATKAAQRGFAEALRHELHGSGVSTTTVYPGQVATSLRRSACQSRRLDRSDGSQQRDRPPAPRAALHGEAARAGGALHSLRRGGTRHDLDPQARPTLGGGGEGLLDRLLRAIEVPKDPDQGRDRAGGR